MTDVLVQVPPGPPCPNCGCTESLEALETCINDLRREKHRRAQERERHRLAAITKASPLPGPGIGAGGAGGSGGGSGGAVVITGGSGGAGGLGMSTGYASKAYVDQNIGDINALEIDKLTCAKCGTWFTKDADYQRESLRDQVRELRIEMEGAIGLLGKLADGG